MRRRQGFTTITYIIKTLMLKRYHQKLNLMVPVIPKLTTNEKKLTFMPCFSL